MDHEGLSWISISTNLLSKKHGNLEQVDNSQNCTAFSITVRISGKLELFANKHRGWISNEKTPIKKTLGPVASQEEFMKYSKSI